MQVIDKSTGQYRVLKTIGSSKNSYEVERLFEAGKQWIKKHIGVQELDFTDYSRHTELVLDGVEEIAVHGPELLLGKLFDEIGFNKIHDELFRRLVVARICYPASKLKTTDYLSKYQYLKINVQQVYRYLDKLYHRQKATVEQISYEHSLKVLGGKISVVFYDVTTLYFECESEDDLRKTGFSKEGKHQHPQIILGLLTSMGGYPLAYDIFEGNRFEGHTMLPVIEAFREKFNLKNLVVVADAGLLSNENINLLKQKRYDYIIGARIKAESHAVKEKILALQLKNGESDVVEKENHDKLIVSYSEARAKKTQPTGQEA